MFGRKLLPILKRVIAFMGIEMSNFLKNRFKKFLRKWISSVSCIETGYFNITIKQAGLMTIIYELVTTELLHPSTSVLVFFYFFIASRQNLANPSLCLLMCPNSFSDLLWMLSTVKEEVLLLGQLFLITNVPLKQNTLCLSIYIYHCLQRLMQKFACTHLSLIDWQVYIYHRQIDIQIKASDSYQERHIDEYE